MKAIPTITTNGNKIAGAVIVPAVFEWKAVAYFVTVNLACIPAE